MTDDHNEVTRIEFINGMENIASGVRALYDQLVREGFSEDQAFKLTCRWIHGLAGGKAE